MNLFETVITDVILAIMPFMLYLIYLIFVRNIEQKENDLFFDIALFSSLYALLRLSPSSEMNSKVVLINIPLFMAFMKQRTFMVILMSAVIVNFSSKYFSVPWFYIGLEYALYYAIFAGMKYKIYQKKYFILTFFILKSIFFFLEFVYDAGLTPYNVGVWLTLYFVFILSLYFSLQLFSKCEEITIYFVNVQNQEQEMMLKSSLFRITHEVKNPIAVCKGYLDMFDVDNPEHSHKYIPIMKEEINRTLLLLQDYLSISKIRLDKDYMDVNLLIEDVMGNFSLMMKEKNIKSELELIDDDIYIMGDYNRLMQVLVNLLKNSMEAIPLEREGVIKVKTTVQNDKFYIEIEDNGEGITKEVMEKIKEPFFTTKTNGTGLGVSLSTEIIKAHAGKLIFDSTPFVGTKVKIWLPIER